jgi:hypothetical protein
MQVMCVKQFENFCKVSFEPMQSPQVGDPDLVIEVIQAYGKVYYKLERFGTNNNYRADHFATLPEQSADEMAEEKHEAIIYQR